MATLITGTHIALGFFFFCAFYLFLGGGLGGGQGEGSTFWFFLKKNSKIFNHDKHLQNASYPSASSARINASEGRTQPSAQVGSHCSSTPTLQDPGDADLG